VKSARCLLFFDQLLGTLLDIVPNEHSYLRITFFNI
jgi:hypothetical protein